MQQVRHPDGAAGRRVEQLGGHLVLRRAALPQQLSRASVLELPLGGRKLLVDGLPDQRVHEPQRRFAVQDLGLGQLRRGLGHARLGHPGQRRDGGQLGGLAEYGDGPRDRSGRLRQA